MLAEIAQRMNSTCEANECIADEYCEKYGRFYNLQEDGTKSNALNRDLVDTVCPRGWLVPNKVEWQTLIDNVENIASRLVEESYVGTKPEYRKLYVQDERNINACGYSSQFTGGALPIRAT